MSAVRLLVVCALVATAGCSGPFLSEASPSESPAAGSTTQAGSPTASPPSTPTTLPDSARNPWQSTDVVVAVDGRADPNRSYVPLVEQAVAYWNGPGRQNATYPVTFQVDPDAPDPDLVVVVREHVRCADHDDVLGCAPQLAAEDRPQRPVTIDVAAGFSNETTQTVIEHEFGHVLGIGHGEPPLPLMEPRHAAATLPQTDAVNKSNPWTTDDIRIYIDLTDSTGDRETLRFQVRQAVDYYDAGAEGHVPSNVSFTVVPNRSRAQVVVVFNQDREECPMDASQSCGSWQGFDPDRDGALEYYTNGTLVLNGIDDDASGWHVGYWLGVLMGHDRPEELAPPFREASYADRRSDWWT
jgi:hypothetical protein